MSVWPECKITAKETKHAAVYGNMTKAIGQNVKDGMSRTPRSCEGLLHLHDALGQVGWDLRQAFAAAVHDVVVAGAAGRTHRHLGGTSPGLRLNWTWRHTIAKQIRQSHSQSVKAPSTSGGRGV